MTQAPSEETRRRHFELWMEVSVVLLVCVVPFLSNSLADIYLTGYPGYYSFERHALTSFVESTANIALVAFIIWRSKEPLIHFGLRQFRLLPDLSIAIGIWVIYRMIYHLVWVVLPVLLSRENYRELVRYHFEHNYASPTGVREYVLLAAISLANGIAEELVIRAYLIPRLEELLDSTALALLLSTVLFTSYHGYQGTASLIGIAILGLVQGTAFCVFRRFAPVALSHALQDFLALGKFRPFGF